MIRNFGHWVFSVAISPDGETLATGGDDGSVRIWHSSIDPGRSVIAPKPESRTIGSAGVLFSPSQRLAWLCHRATSLLVGDNFGEAEPYLREIVVVLRQGGRDADARASAIGRCLDLLDALQQADIEPSDLHKGIDDLAAIQRDLTIQGLRQKTNEDPQMRAREFTWLRSWEDAARHWARVIDIREDPRTYPSPRQEVCRQITEWPEVSRRVAELRPDEPAVWIGRGQYWALRSHWPEALEAYRRGARLSRISDTTFQYAGILMLAGDRQQFRDYCSRLTSLVDEPHDSFTAFQLAHSCGIAAENDVPLEKLVEWAKKGVTENKNAWELHVLGLAQYRAGQFDEAIQSLETSNAGNWPPLAKVQNDLVLAMAHHWQGNHENAEQFLHQAKAAIDKARPLQADEPVAVAVPDWIGIEVLRREAEGLIESPENLEQEQNENEELTAA
jgi:tetratricopeptide (TPR) repeat protein